MSKPTRADGAPASGAGDALLIQLLELLPKNSLSRAVGQLSELPIPPPFRRLLYGTFAQRVGANVSEAAAPLESYPTFNAFFTRALRHGARPIDRSVGVVTSPVDAVLSQFGPIHDGQLTQTKGRTYTLTDLISDPHEASAFEGGTFMTLYLSPKDYHRVHSPVLGSLMGWRYTPGHLFPVNRAAVHNVDRLFCVNERVTIYIDAFAPQHAAPDANSYQATPMAAIMVGATCVGRMTLSFDDLTTNISDTPQTQRVHYDQTRPIDRADELGMFNLGSTVILLIGPGPFKVKDDLEPGATVKLGQPIGYI